MSKLESPVQVHSSDNDEFPQRNEVASDVTDRTCDSGLKVVDLRKAFVAPNGERIEVLRGVTVSITAGESVAITGASGSGKSTFLHLLGGLEVADHGTIWLGEADLGLANGRELASLYQSTIGFVFQFHYLLPDLSAVENVALPLLIARHRPGAALVRARQELTRLGLEDRVDHPVAHLSGGEQQRVAVARALIVEPKLVLADEPTGNLDAEIGDEIGKTLIHYARTNLAVVVIATHNQSLAGLCDRALILKDRRLYPV
jgi:lipoprotein-releasing system ATP-binding protein